MDEQEKKLNLMRYWLFGLFVIVWAAVLVYIGGALGIGLLIFRQWNLYLAILITAVLCVAWYYIYKWYLERNN